MKLPPAFVINLDRDVKRWEKAKHVFAKAGLREVQRVSAVDGRKLKLDEELANITWLARWLTPPGVIGCAMSHINLWRKVVEDRIPAAIVFEDDVELVPFFHEKLEECLEYVQSAYPPSFEAQSRELKVNSSVFDVILLGGLGQVHPLGLDPLPARAFSRYFGGRQRLERKNKMLYRPVRPAGTHAYIISLNGAKKLLERCPKARYHIDIDAWGQNNVEVLMFDPMLAYQSFDSSSIVEYLNRANTKYDLIRLIFRGEFGSIVPDSIRDRFTHQTLRHALSEPLLQFSPNGPLLRHDQNIFITSSFFIFGFLFRFLNLKKLSGVALLGGIGYVLIIRALILMLLHSK